MEVSTNFGIDYIKTCAFAARHSYIEDMESQLISFERRLQAKNFRVYWASTEDDLVEMVHDLLPGKYRTKVCFDLATIPEGFKEIRVGFSDCVNLKTIYLPSTITTICGYALTNCMRLDKIVFNGTKAQWKAIELDDHWNYSAPALGIECTDGYIELQSWYESH